MAKIKQITAREILNAKGLSTIEATVELNDGKIGVASCPRGEIIGNYEALEIKDTPKAINNIVSMIAPILIGKDVERQQEIDKLMIDLDGTQNKSRLGANAIFSVSMAVAKAGAESSVLPLFLYLRQFVTKSHDLLKIPVPIFNFKEFLVLPASSKSYTESIQIGENFYKFLEQNTDKEALPLISQAIDDAHVKLGFDVFLGLDARASVFFKDGKYKIKDSATLLSSKDLINYYVELNNNIHLLYLEDPMNQDDWEGYSMLFEKLSKTTIIAGGDLIATNPYRLQIALDKKAINGIVIKPNQIGTVIEALAVAEAAKETGLKVIVSHRSNETNDDFIADFAVAVGADYIKIGSLNRGENIAKYNRLLQIENQLKIL